MDELVSLSQQAALDHETLWRYMRLLLERMARVFEQEDVVDDCLDVVVDLLGADRGVVLLASSDGAFEVINARGPQRSLAADEREEISRTIVRQCLETGGCIVSKGREDGRSILAGASAVNFGIHAAFAAPLHGRGREPRGALYVDFRRPDSFIDRAHVEFFMAAVILLSAVIEQHRLGQQTRGQLAEAKSQIVESRHTPPLTDLLAPPSMLPIREELDSALMGMSPMLILGESGSGKTLLAQAIAEASGRRPIVRVVLGGTDDLNAITSELFGHEKGAYTGAISKRTGMVEFAHGGTLILDEILNLAPQAQKLLLDFTQFGTYRPLGYTRPEPKRADVRILAVTNGDIDAAQRDGRFREDLYHRLAAVRIDLPSLRDRREDLAALAEGALRRSDPARRWTLSPDLRRALASSDVDWNGNIRELELAVIRGRERAVARDPTSNVLTPEHMRLGRQKAGPAAPQPAIADENTTEPLETRWKSIDALLISERLKLAERALALHEDNAAAAADALGIPPTTLRSFLRAHRPKTTT